MVIIFINQDGSSRPWKCLPYDCVLRLKIFWKFGAILVFFVFRVKPKLIGRVPINRAAAIRKRKMKRGQEKVIESFCSTLFYTETTEPTTNKAQKNPLQIVFCLSLRRRSNILKTKFNIFCAKKGIGSKLNFGSHHLFHFNRSISH